MSNPNNFYDVSVMLKTPELENEPDLVIDGVHFGRGDGSYYNQKTIDVKIWKVVNEHLEEIKDGHFYDSESYIVRWDSITEKKKEKRIYFHWKGVNAKKGYSPLPIEEGDSPLVERIVQWAEPPAFLRLFQGSFIVHSGRSVPSDEARLYILRGELEKERHLYQVALKAANLRSRTCFVAFLPKEKSAIVWNGSMATSICRNLIKIVAGKHFGFDFEEVNENEESRKFLNLFSFEDGFFFKNVKIFDHTPRLFYFNQIGGCFNSIEVECCHRSQHVTPFPFLQSHLYTADQPACFLLDDHDEIWLWQWYGDEDTADFSCKCLTATVNYAKEKSKLIKKNVKVQKVVAGHEPIAFTNLFPTWNEVEDIIKPQIKRRDQPESDFCIEITPNGDVEK